MKEQLKELDQNAKGKLYIQRKQSLNTPRVEVCHGVRIKNINKVLGKRHPMCITGLSISIGSKRKGEKVQYIKLDHEILKPKTKALNF